MTMKNIYRFLFALAPSKLHIFALFFCLVISSCGLEEPYNSSDESDVIEFVARPLGYNNQMVETKSAANDFEKEIHNCFFLLFDNATGARINTPENLVGSDVTTLPTQLVKLDKVNAKSVTACFIANVPSDFVSNIIGLTRPDNVSDTEANNQKYLNSAVLSGITYGTGNNFGKPYIDLDGATGSNNPVACIPMLGTQEIILSSANNIIQVALKRLFAKVTVDLKLDMNLSDWNNVIQTYTYLQVNYYELRNMPNRVRLIESTEQSAWVTDPNLDAFVTSEISSGTINKQIYNQSSNTSNNKSCIFEFYAPEYYLNRKSDWTNDEKSKPNNKPANAKAIYLFLDTTYSQYSLTTTNLQYEIYLGGDQVSDFSLARNVNYINTLTVKGIDKSDVDHRVSTTVINNPVAKGNESANCYIISTTGDYYFPAYKGAYKDLKKAVLCNNPKAKLEQIANDNISNIVLQNLNYDKDKNIVSFNISKIADGNVVIALVDDKGTDVTTDDEIEWSWHLWCHPIEDYDILGWGQMDTQVYPNGAIMMDRNLGASPNSVQSITPGIVTGLYYRYGCKEPFIENSYRGGGTNGTNTWNPSNDSNLSDNTKSVVDPCPPGYSVPSSSVFSSNVSKRHEITYTAFSFWNNNSSIDIVDDIYFPYSGELQNSNKQTKNEESQSRNYTTIISDPLTIDPYRFNNIYYPETSRTGGKYGVLATVNQSAYIQYLYISLSFEEVIKNLTPIKLDYQKGTRKGGLLNGWYEYTDDWNEGVQYSSLSYTIKGYYQTAKTWDSVTSGISNLFGTSIIMNYSADANNGYQVRCVSEDSPIK